MKEIERINVSPLTQKTGSTPVKDQKATKPEVHNEDSIITNTQPELDSIEDAEAFLKQVTSKLDSKAFDAQTAKFDEDRIKALLSDD